MTFSQPSFQVPPSQADSLEGFRFSAAFKHYPQAEDLARTQILKGMLSKAAEPGSQVTAFDPREAAAIEEAYQFLVQLYKSENLPVPSRRPKTILSGLHSASGFAGAAYGLTRIAERYPGLTENQLLRTALWVHEFSHLFTTRQVLTILSPSSHKEKSTPEVCLRANGWLHHNSVKGLHRLRAFEEYAACIDEDAFLAAQGGVAEYHYENITVKDRTPRNPAFIMNYVALKNPLGFALYRQEPPQHALDQATDHCFATTGFKYATRFQENTHENAYSQLVAAFDFLSREIYPELSVAEALKKFRSHIRRAHAGESLQPVLQALRQAFGPKAVVFFSSLGSVHNTELMANSASMVLLWQFTFLHNQSAEEKAAARERICDTALAWEKEQIELLTQVPERSHVEQAVKNMRDAIEQGLTYNAVAYFEGATLSAPHLSATDGAKILATIKRQNRHPFDDLVQLLKYHRVFDRTSFKAAYDELLALKEKHDQAVARGDFTTAGPLDLEYGFARNFTS